MPKRQWDYDTMDPVLRHLTKAALCSDEIRAMMVGDVTLAMIRKAAERLGIELPRARTPLRLLLEKGMICQREVVECIGVVWRPVVRDERVIDSAEAEGLVTVGYLVLREDGHYEARACFLNKGAREPKAQ